jgi:hypothetical protein
MSDGRFLPLLLGLAISMPAVAATSVSNGKVTRIRDNASLTKVYIEVTPRPATLDCVGTLTASETYVIDADTVDGRALYAQVLAAYNTQTTVGILGSGVCETVTVSIFTTRFERVARLVACNPANPPTCTPGAP